MLFDLVLEEDKPYCADVELQFKTVLKEHALYVTSYETATITIDLPADELPYATSANCPFQTVLQIYSEGKWVDITSVISSDNHVSKGNASVELAMKLADLSAGHTWISSDGTVKYRYVVYDTHWKDYAPSLDMVTELIPAEKRIAV